ncbi:TniQ family protein [Ferdinandcohnia quinoae]|uniref:TniQ family protein n=1 Tax=Fredinandcohnia quinoae TaxID=2918902 RepID=A0AAW5E3D5_9BACI|nr:TniQ family protein [Fredinandcohnia sp. SECRCQ15]MCH1627435.1 TniQ family protein [Fredinandcohnia sp. SECRCQ15]
MENIIRLLVSPPPIFDESLEGYIARLTTINGYESVRWICDEANILTNYKKNIATVGNISYQKDNIRKLSAITGSPDKMLWDLTFHNQFGNVNESGSSNFIDKFLHSFALNGWKIKICPKCLKENNYIRKLWSLSIYNVCHLHSCALIKECPYCGEAINISYIPIGSCRCGGNLCSIEEANVTDLIRNVEHFLYSKLYCIEELGSYTNNYLLNLEFKLVVFLIMYFARKIDKVLKSEKIFMSTQASFALFYDWKENFYNFLDDYTKQPKGSDFTGLRKDFGTLHKDVLGEFKNTFPNQLEFITSAFEEYLTEKWDRGYLTNYTTKRFGLERKWLSKDEVVEILRIAPFTLDGLIEAGVIPARVHIKAERKLVLIHRDSVKKYISESKREINVQETREKLGITDVSIIKLIDAGILIGENRLKNKKTWSINTESVDKILEKFESKVRNEVNLSKDRLISFHKCLRITVGEHKDIVDFIKAVFSDEINQIFSKENKKGLIKYYFIEDEIRKVMGEENIYSLSQISRELEVEKILVSFWIKKGFIQGEVTDKKIRITKEDFEKFMSTYITMKEICRRTNYRPRTVLAYFKGYNINAQSGGKVDGSRMYLFFRKDIEPIIKSWVL